MDIVDIFVFWESLGLRDPSKSKYTISEQIRRDDGHSVDLSTIL